MHRFPESIGSRQDYPAFGRKHPRELGDKCFWGWHVLQRFVAEDDIEGSIRNRKRQIMKTFHLCSRSHRCEALLCLLHKGSCHREAHECCRWILLGKEFCSVSRATINVQNASVIGNLKEGSTVDEAPQI